MFKFSKSKHVDFAKLYYKFENVYNQLPQIKKAKRKKIIFKTLKFLSFFFIGTAALLIIFFGVHIFSLKEIYTQSIQGKIQLEQAVLKAETQDFEGSAASAVQASNKFNAALNNIEELKDSYVVSRFPIVKIQLEDLGYLLNSVEILSRSVAQGSRFGNEVQKLLDGDKKITYSTFTAEEKKRVLKKIFDSGPELAGMKANLDLALLSFDKISYTGILWPLKSKILEVKSKVEEGDNLLAQAFPMSQLLPVFTGFPKKSTFLVLFQNSDELRPTGGFLGTYGILQTENADITRFDTHDIYHMDMPVQDKLNIIPPDPIKKYLNQKWYMRDANWLPDWPSSAQKIEWFYKTENKLLTGKNQINNFDGEFDGILAITPRLATELLSMVGPINIDGQEYNSENFTEILEYRVEKGYAESGIPSWQRKEVVGDILKEMKIRLLNLPSNRWKEIIKTINTNLARKDILIYLKDPQLETLVVEQNWGGELKNNTDDFVMLVDSNMAALKTDASITRNIRYDLSETAKGLIAKATINYAHQGRSDWKTSEYKSFTRLYVPSGSTLINVSGFEKNSLVVQNESNKTSFGGLLKVDPGSVGTLVFEYELPQALNNKIKSDGYDLLFQKQPSSRISELAVDVKLANVIKSYSPVGFSVDKNFDREISWTTDFEMDKYFNISFD